MIYRVAEVEAETPRPDSAAPGPRGAIIGALVLLFIDGFVLNQGAIALLVAACIVLFVLPYSMLAKKYRGARLQRLRNLGIGLAGVAAVLAFNIGSNRLAAARAVDLIAAIKAYYAEQHRYPDTLQELVPRYIAAIPRAKYTLFSGDFSYRNNATGAVLEYIALPPFGRPYYSFTAQRWLHLD